MAKAFGRLYVLVAMMLIFVVPVVAQNTLTTLGLTSSTSSAAAYSLRKLSSSYTGPLVRIYNGTTYYDVYPDATTGWIESTSKISASVSTYNAAVASEGTSALSTITAASTIAVWYDQSGNSRDVLQIATNRLPSIWTGTSVRTNGNIKAAPAAHFNGSSTRLQTVSAATWLNATAYSLSAVVETPGSSNANYFLGTIGATTNKGLQFGQKTNTQFTLAQYSNDANYSITQETGTSLRTAIKYAGTGGNGGSAAWLNGTSLGTNSNPSAYLNTIGQFNIGFGFSTATTPINSWLGYISEILVFTSEISNAARQLVETNQATAFGVTVPSAPTISAQPSTTAQSVCLNGTPTNLSVTASVNSGSITYQWYSNASASNTTGTLISGETSSSYTPNTTASGSTYYYCVLTNSSSGYTTTSNVSGAVKVSNYPGNFGNALNFDGSNDVVNVSTGSATVSSTYTFEVWAKPSTTTGMITFFGSRTNSVNSFDVKFKDGNIIHGDIGDGTNWLSTTADASLNYVAGQWYHIAYVVTPTGYTIYINGIQSASGTFSGTPLLFNSTTVTQFGNNGRSTAAEFFDGSLDEARIWNVARTQSQIQASMNTELMGNESGLVAYYNFNQGTAGGTNTGLTTLNDITSNGYNGTLNSFALTGSTSNWVTGNSFSIASITGTSLICSNATSQMSNATLGGVWSFPNSTYATVNSTGLVSGVAAGTPTLSYTLTSGAGCASAATQVITVRSAFTTGAISTTGESICSGGTPTVIGSATASSGGDGTITYSWRSSTDSYASAISGATSATYTPPAGLTSTTSYRRYANDGTCSTTPTVSTGTWTVTVNTIPTITLTVGSDTICAGSSTTFTASGATTYSWSPSTGLSATTGSTVTASPTTTTTYTVTGTTNGCSATNSSTVIAYPVFSPGSSHVLAIKPNGTLWGWGSNGSGALGNGSTTNVSTSTQIGSDNDWMTVSAGYETGYGIKTDGKLYSWGLNTYGQLGYTTSSYYSNSPAQVGSSTDWAKVYGGNNAAFGIKTDGTLWVIGGSNSYGQLGLADNSDRNSPVQIGTSTNWVKVGVGASFTVGIKSDGTIWAWGDNGFGQLGQGDNTSRNVPTQVGIATDWTDIIAQNHSGHCFAVKSNGTVWAWGNNFQGQLGISSSGSGVSTPTQILSGSTWSSLAVNEGSSYAVKSDGKLYTWGSQDFGALGDGNTMPFMTTTPTQVGTETTRATVYSGRHSGYATKTDGSIWAWGENGQGQLGYGNTTYSEATPVQIEAGVTGVGTVTVKAAPTTANAGTDQTGSSTCGLTTVTLAGNTPSVGTGAWSIVSGTGGTITTPASATSTFSGVAGATYILRWTISNSPCTPSTDDVVITFNTTPTVTLTVGSATICAGSSTTLTASGATTYSWSPSTGLSATTGSSVTASPTTTTTYTVTGTTNGCSATNSSTVIAYPVFSPGSSHLLAIKPNGTLWGWGANDAGGLGNGSTTNVSSSTQIGSDNDWQSVSAGNQTGYGIKTNGKLYSWGYNSAGQLGNGSSGTNTSTPAQVGSSTDWAKVFGGHEAAFGIKTDGTLWAIGGSNISGRLGLGDDANRNSPVQIGTSTNWVKVGVGASFTVGIKSDGTIWAWGDNGFGQLGQGNTTPRNTPVQVGTETDWTDIIAQNHSGHCFALKSNGTVWAWGNNSQGMLGTGSSGSSVSTPTQILSGSTWSSLAINENSSYAVKSDGKLYTWGSRMFGALGDGNDGWMWPTSTESPTQVGTATNWTAVYSGRHSGYATKTDGSIWAWGENGQGQLGYRNTTYSEATPVQIEAGVTGVGTVTVNAAPTTAAAGTDQTGSSTCGLTTVTLAGNTPSVGTGAWSIVSGTGGTITTPSSATSTFSGLAGSTYTLRWTISNSPCTPSTDDVVITFNTTPNVTLTVGSATICAGSSTTLTASGATTYSWSPSTGLSATTGGVVTASPTTTTTYTVTGTTNGCSATNSSTVIAYSVFSPGTFHVLGVKPDGTLWGWGDNTYGALGNGTNTSTSTSTQIGSDNDWQSVSAGFHTGYGIKTNGKLYSWGYNEFGELGNGSTGTNTNSPVQVGSATNWSFVYGGSGVAFGIKTDGTLWLIGGYNESGRFGLGSSGDRNSEIQIGTDNNWVKVGGGASFTVGLKSNGTIWAWGDNSFGQLGQGNTTPRNTPVQVGTETDWTDIVAQNHSYHCFAVKSNGTLWGWGDNRKGQLGLGSSVIEVLSPTQISAGSTWLSVANSIETSYAIKSDGTLWTWGNREYGVLGDGNTMMGNTYTPTQVGTATNWTAVYSGRSSGYAIKFNGSIHAWGRNYLGQLGYGTTSMEEATPVQIEAGVTGVGTVTVNANSSAAVISGTATITSGNSTNLSVAITGGTSPYTVVYTDGTSNFTVSSYVSGSNISVSPTTTTTYTLVSVTGANGCAGTGNSGSAVVTVNAGPTASVISGTATICSGTSTNLSVAITGGTSPFTVVYYNGTSNTTVSSYISGANISVSPTTTTTYTIVSVTDANGQAGTGNSGSAVVTVNALPTPTFTVQPGATACANTDVTYTTQSGQSSYVWTIPGTLGTDYSITSGGTGTDHTVTLKWLTTGSKTVTINYTNSNSCTAASATSSTTTTVNPLPTITTAGTTTAKCFSASAQTTSLVYTATTQSPTSYSIDWDATANSAGLADQGSTSYAFIAGGGTLSTISITAGTPAGTYNGTMTITNANGCTKTQAVTVEIYALPVIVSQSTATQTVCQNSTASTFTVTATGTGLTYQWYSNTTASNSGGTSLGTATGAQTSSYTPLTTVAGTTYYYCVVTNSNSCTATSAVSGDVIVNAVPVVAGVAQSGQFGNGLNFAGSYVVSAVSGTSLTTFTFESYIKFTTNETRGILQWANALGSAGPFIYWKQEGLNLVMYVYADYRITTTLTLNDWYHVALVYNGTVYTLYINGSPVGTYTGPLNAYNFQNSATSLYLGNGYHGYFSGSMDEVRVWNTARSQSDIQSSMNTELAGSETGLMAYYNFNQGTAGANNSGVTTLIDRTSNAKNGTLTGFSLTGSTSNWVTGAQSAGGSSSAGAVCIGSTIQLSNTTTGGVWSTSDANIATVSSTGVVTGIAAGTATISYTVTNVNNCSTTATTSVTVNSLPVITSQSTATQRVIQNGTASAFSVTATGTGLTYQWYSNATATNTGGTSIASATSSTYTPLTTSVGTFYYYCIVTNSSSCTATSSVSGAVIIEQMYITSTGTLGALCNSTSAQTSSLAYTAAVNSPTAYSIDWSAAANTAGLTDQTSTSYSFVAGGGTIPSIPIAAGLAAGTYTGVLTVTNANNLTNTINVSITINPLPTITTVGTATAKCFSASAQTTSLVYTATTQSPISYSIDWDATANSAGLSDQGSTSYTFIAGGGTLSTISITAGTPAGTYNGTMTITNANGCTKTQAVTVEIYALPVIVSQSTATQSICLNFTATSLTVTATDAGAVTYQWYRRAIASNTGGTSLGTANGAQTATYTPPTSVAGTTYYYCVVTNSNSCTATSAVSGAIVVNALPTPTFTTQPSSIVCISSDVTYTTQSGQSNYVWVVPGTLGTDYSITSGGVGSTDNTVTLKWLTSGSKTVTINYTNSNGCTAVSSTSTSSTVYDLPVFLTQPSTSAQSLCSGAGSLLVEADPGAGTITSYSWYSNASNANTGGSLVVTNASTTSTNSYSPTTSAYYYATITNSYGCTTASAVSGLITITAAPTISAQPSASAQSLCINGTPTNLSVTASAGSGAIASYKWYSNTSNSTSGGTLISTTVGSLTTNSYTPSTATAGTTYYYCVVTNSNGCSVTSTVSGAITVSSASVGGTATAASAVLSSGGTTTLSLSGYTGSIQWQQSANGSTGWSNVSGGSGATSATYTTAALSTTTYYKAVVTSGGCAAASSNNVSVTIPTPSPISSVDVLVVGGGGGGSARHGGGGGGGQVKTLSNQTISSTISITVGSGGTAGVDGTTLSTSTAQPNTSAYGVNSGGTGQTSSFGAVLTGYGGASGPADQGGRPGGNAWKSNANPPESPLTNYWIGGSGSYGSGTAGYAGGGGAGSGGNGGNSSPAGNAGGAAATGGSGGVGTASTITGTEVFYGGGGGGGAASNSSAAGAGGNGGGGAGGKGAAGSNGTANTGGGGGGSGFNPANYIAGAGGSGVVIIRYPGTVALATGGNISYITSPSNYVVHTFTSSGTISLGVPVSPVSLTSTGVAATVCTSIIAQTTTLAYSASTGSPTSYSIDWSAAAFTDQNSTSYTFVSGGGSITGIVVPAGLAAGTYSGTMTITNGSSTTTQAISLAVGSVSGTITGAGTVTSGTNSTTLTLSGYTGSIQWQSSTDNSTYSNISLATSASYIATNLTATRFYKAVVTNGACAAATSSAATITVSAPSTAFNITGSTTANTMSNNVATVVDPNLVVTANGTVSGFTVTITGDYTNGDVLGYTGSLPSGVTAAAFNTTSRSINFTGTASAADWQTLLRTVTLTSTSNCYPTNRKVSFLPSNKYYNYFNGHYYEYISTALSWTAAKSAAASRSFYGRKGYLVTISSESENNYIWKLISQNSWIGLSCVHTEINSALGYNRFGSTTYGQFYWVTGPEKGTAVSTGLGGSLSAVSGIYNNWTSGEPNNYRSWGENSGHMFSTSGKWNDFRAEGANNGREPIPYIVEYGGSQGDDVSATISFTRDIIISGSPAGSVTGADTVCNGTNTTTLTFSGGGTIQRWEYSTDNFVTAGTTVASTASTLTATNLSSSRYYRAVVNTAGCTDLASSSALITVATTTAGSITATSADVCAGGSAALTLNGNSGDIQKWQVSTSSDFTTGVTDISNTTNTLSHTLSANGTYYFRASVLNSACVAGTAVYTEGYPVTVTTGTAPVGGTVNSVAYCGGSNSGTLTLSGSTGTSYQWEVSTDGGIVWTNASSTSITQSYTGISTTTKYRVLVTNGSCGSVYSSVGTITIGGTSGAQWIGTFSSDWGNTANWCGYIIGDDGLDVTISALAINAPTLDRDRRIGNLNFNGSNNVITLGNFTLTATSFTNAAALNYVKTTGTGKLKVSISPSITISLPVGNTSYNPVSITNNNSSSDYFTARVLDEVYANSVSGTANSNGRVKRTWDLGKTNANSGSGVNFVFNWNAGEETGLTLPAMFNYTGGNWARQGGTTSYTSTSLTYTGYTGTISSFAVLQSFYTWTGLGGDDLWNNGNNWSTGTAPIATSDIIINSGTPKMNIDYTAEGTLTIGGTGTLTINAGKTLTVASGAVVNFGDKSVTIKSDVTGTAQIGRILGTLNGATNVTVERYIPATGRKYRMIAPSVNSTGSIRDNWMEGNMNTSTRTNVNALASYGTQITGSGGNANGFDATSTNSASLYLASNGVNPGYTPVANTSGALNALTGYFLFLRGDRSTNMNMINTNLPPIPIPLPSSATTLRATGTIVQGTVTSFTNALSSAAGGFSLVTNPYPAAIDWASVYAASTNLNNYYSYWDPSLGFRGGFVTVNSLGVNSSLLSLASKIIQSGQAFFVTTALGGITPTISIQESHKVGPSLTANNVHGIFKANLTVDDIVSTKVKGISPVWENYQPNLQQTTSTIPEFRMSLYYTEASGAKRLTDGAVALFDNQYTSALDGNDAVDAPNWDENIAITRNGQNLAIESRAALNENDTLAISMSGMKVMNYELQFQGSNFGSTLLQPMLIDNYLKTLSTLSLTLPTTVPFTVTSDTATSSKNRFKVVFKTSVVLPFTVTKITATKKNETVQVDWEVKTDEELKSFDVERSSDGRTFVKLATVASLGKGIAVANYSWVDNNPLMGENYYRINVVPQVGKERVSPVAMVTFDKQKPLMVVYPNPTEGNDFSIKLSNLTKGIYQIIVTTATGQLVLEKTIEHPGGTTVQRMVFANDITKGVYRVQVKGEGLSLLSSIIKN